MTWPTTIDSDSTLYLAVDFPNSLTVLNGAINSSITTITVTNAFNYPSTGGLILIDAELISFAGKSGNTLTGCVRALDNTVAAAHANGALVNMVVVAEHHNVVKNSIIAIQTDLASRIGQNTDAIALKNLTTTQRNAIVSPVAGMIIYNITTSRTEFYNGTSWVAADGITDLTGDVTATGPGSAAATVVSVGGSSASNVHSAELAANAATSSNTSSTIVKRDGSNNFSAGTITANLTGTASGNLTAATGVTDVHSDSNAAIHGSVQLVSGTNVTLSQTGSAITVNATSGGGGGKLIQLVDTFNANFLNNGSTSFTDVGISLSITPTLSTSRIRCTVVIGTVGFTTNTGNSTVKMTVLRGSTNIGDATNGLAYVNSTISGDHARHPVTIVVMDSPATTSSTTYKLQALVSSGDVMLVGSGDSNSLTMILEEIGI